MFNDQQKKWLHDAIVEQKDTMLGRKIMELMMQQRPPSIEEQRLRAHVQSKEIDQMRHEAQRDHYQLMRQVDSHHYQLMQDRIIMERQHIDGRTQRDHYVVIDKSFVCTQVDIVTLPEPEPGVWYCTDAYPEDYNCYKYGFIRLHLHGVGDMFIKCLKIKEKTEVRKKPGKEE